ncbi:HTH-type transcriptional regulator AlkS [compost metagenome]
MPNKRIARVLGISPETVKWHLKNVYGKLGVLGRDEAVLRARHLGLIDTALRDIRFSASPPR